MKQIERLLTIGEVALYLRMNTSTVYRLARAGILPCIRIGRSLRVRTTDLASFMEERST